MTLVELLVALLLTALVVQGAWSVVAGQRRAVGRLLEASERAAAERIVWELLRDELRSGLRGRDFDSLFTDSVALRAFRGTGRVCPWRPGGGRLLVDYQGVRLPDPAKDSALVLVTGGRWVPAAVAAWQRSRTGCPADAAREVGALTLEPVPEGAVLVRIFERGSYHLADDALRYRRGAGGRQPMTPAVLDPEAVGLSSMPGGAVRLDLAISPGPLGAGRRLWGRRVWPRGSAAAEPDP